MIRSFRHKGLEAFFKRGTKAGIQPHHAAKLRLQLTALDAATKPGDLAAPGWRLHPLTGDSKGFFSITVNGNWRVIFRFVEHGVELVDYLDYH
jgi:proteic killer suppression protein